MLQIVDTESEKLVLENDLKTIRGEAHISELAYRRQVYAKILSYWPAGSILSADISRVISEYKKKLEKKPQEETMDLDSESVTVSDAPINPVLPHPMDFQIE